MIRDTLPLLSKSRFSAGLQCHKRLFLECYARELADPVDPALEALFESGTAVGVLARQRFPGGRLIREPFYEHTRAVRTTEEVMADRSLPSIYEAAFTFDDVRVRADVLVRNGDRTFDLVEVKSSTAAREEHVADVAIQLYVVEGSGISVRRASLLHIDNSYVYQGGPYDVHRLFQLEDVTPQARAFVQSPIPTALSEMREALRLDQPPAIEIGRHCRRPYQCQFYGHCRQGEPDNHIEQLPWARSNLLEELLDAGIRDIRNIPAGFPGLSDLQQRVRESVATGRPHLDPELKVTLNAATYPVYFLDFETFNPALPLYPGTRPYQVIPFQWSLHVRDATGGLEHRSFLHDGGGDPREAFATSLLDAIGADGTIVTYSGYEWMVISQLASDLSQFADHLLPLGDRVLDLLEVLRSYYYHPGFHGSYSMKSVLPVLVPELGYEDLEIQEGGQASLAFSQLIAPETEGIEKERLRLGLLAYCQRDTEAMVRIFDSLR